MTGLISLSERRSVYLLRFAKTAARHPVHGPRMFPENPETQDINNLRDKEKFVVNFAGGRLL